ncbi:hypothetical protein NA57DRAFT_76514 [Rhizodiscina lignyota]|uniref:Peroxisomal biogenesis factor 11 n=1 Tax=Rhizodiscina lignyota TaxID=1504668 RepID=A0A9P4M9E3_9PEZI|nr:hypothetical protein NA57DRAFT_76514 [Rhizodiscina lignyota]
MSKDVAPSKVSHDALAKLFSSPLDARITQMTRILSTAAGIDSTFCFLGYSMVFVSSQLRLLSEVSPTPLLEKVSWPNTVTYKAKMLELADSAKALGGVCSDARTFLRLWGLLKIYVGMKALYLSPPKDSIIKYLAWGQLTAMGAYLINENQVYLASKGVLKGRTPAQLGVKLRLAIWVFGAYLVLDFARLFRTWQVQQKAVSSDEKDVIAKREEENRSWYRSLWVDSSYFPLCFHWGVEGGSLPTQWADMVVGLLGASAGFANFREQVRINS